MVLFGGDFGLTDFIYEKLNRFRKRLPTKTRKFIASFITKTVFVFSIAGPVMTLPQVFQIYSTQNVGGLSILTWFSYIFISIFWLNYGLLIRNKPIVIANVSSLLINISTIIAIFLYR